jgi:hypothetical protein
VIRFENVLMRAAVIRAALAGLALAFAGTLATEALAAPPKSTQTEARFIKFDSAANTVSVKADKSTGPNKSMLKKGQDVTFNVVPEGSILSRTSVAINGKKGEVADIPAGKQVNVYWIPDPKKDGEYFAKKIDVVLSDEELDALYGSE